jgi:hypothetical protein
LKFLEEATFLANKENLGELKEKYDSYSNLEGLKEKYDTATMVWKMNLISGEKLDFLSPTPPPINLDCSSLLLGNPFLSHIVF